MNKTSKLNSFIEKHAKSLTPEAVAELSSIAKEEDYLRKAFDYNPCTICVIDENDNYLNANSKMLNMLNISADDFFGKQVGSITKDTTVMNLIRELKNSDEDSKHLTIEAIVNGQKKFFWISANKIGNRVLTTGLDITDLKQLEEEKKFNDKLALLGEMSSFIVHEINNPLSAIIMATELIEMENEDLCSEALEKYTNQIKTMSSMIEKIIANLKSIVRQDTQTKTEISLQEVFAKSKIILSGKIKKSNVKITGFNLDKGTIWGTELNLIQVLVNLISNSIDALDDLPEKWVEVKWENDSLKIIDSGNGIPPQIESNLFKKHYTSKGNKGNGIGLYLSRDLLRKLGYDLVYKLEGNNTSFQWVPIPQEIQA